MAGSKGQSSERSGSGHTPVVGSQGQSREKGIGPHACGRVKEWSQESSGSDHIPAVQRVKKGIGPHAPCPKGQSREKGTGPHACGRVKGSE